MLDPPGEPADNMARDEELARQVRAGQAPPTLRIYGWTRPAISLGRRQQASELGTRYRVPGTDLRSLPVVRRPTGGGAVVHSPEELTYGLALPLPVPGTGGTWYRAGTPARELPGAIHASLRGLLVEAGFFGSEDLTVAEGNCREPFTFCFEAPACGDLLCKGRKVAGSALRVWRDGLLIQGSLQGLPAGYNQLARALALSVQEVLLHEETIHRP